MALATWWRGDSVPTLSLLPGFRVEASRDAHLIADITRLALDEVDQRMHVGHPAVSRLYRAHAGRLWLDGDTESLDRRAGPPHCVARNRSVFMGLCHAP